MISMAKSTFLFLLLASLAVLGGCSSTPTPSVIADRPATISGFVFRDLNSDGVRDSREPGEPGITVSAYDVSDRIIATATTDVNGNYALGAGSSSRPIVHGENYRVVFSGWPAQLSPGPHGKDSGTEQQFVTGGATGVNFGLFSSDQFVPPEATLNVIRTRQAATPSGTPQPTPIPSPTPAAQPTSRYEGSAPAAEFISGPEWLNVRQPLTLAGLKGKVVLLEFWTYGCTASTQVFPQLKALQEKYADELVIIGVHAAKYPHEGETENIRRSLERFNLALPVINDRDYGIAQQYGASIWPTFVLINPEGRNLATRTGDLKYAELDAIIARMIEDFDARHLIDRSPLDQLLTPQPAAADSPLRFPNAVLADEARNRLFIVDSNHQRVVITDLAGNVKDVVGNGEPALRDGTFATASFNQPQGITLAGPNTLYVADTGNHAIRRINLTARTVETVAGTGKQSMIVANNGPALMMNLNSPADVRYVGNLLYIAMAGQHQLWVYDPATQQLGLFAGTGVEQLTDGPLLSAGLNQPGALTTDGQIIYVADSEGNAIRRADTDLAGEVKTIVGQGFYKFGDVDGLPATALLQRPSGIAYKDDLLYVADTYNNKIKTVDPQTGETRAFVGVGQSGWRDGAEPLFDEPNGLSITSNKLYVADANNHAIRIVDLATKLVSTLKLTDPEGLLKTR